MYIIAEIGVNHNGNIDTAKELIDHSVSADADAVKFQLWKKDRFPEIENLRLSKSDIDCLFNHARKLGVTPFATAFDLESIDFLSMMQDIWKIPSGMVTNATYLKKIASMVGIKILSTGMANENEIRDALERLPIGTVVMQCTTAYPAPIEEINLAVLNGVWSGCKSGYSDHSGLPYIAPAAVALGAEYIEAHITLDKNSGGPDHKASLDPVEFSSMVNMCRDVVTALGDFHKNPTISEKKHMHEIRDRMKL